MKDEELSLVAAVEEEEVVVGADAEASAGWRYPSNQRLKQVSYLYFSGVHSGERDLGGSRQHGHLERNR